MPFEIKDQQGQTLKTLAAATLRGADLRGANLRGANLYGADLRWADLRRADLYGANLRWADLYGADLYGANLRGANLRRADLRGANLRGANLYEADLREANLYEADLREAKNIPVYAVAVTTLMGEGQIIGWKKCCGSVLVKLSIPAEAKRSNATGRKCRAEYIDVLEVIGAEKGISKYDDKTIYEVGKRIHCDKWDEDRWQECAGGIHFFITRYEAENY